jgi:nucleoside-diphosphate-sugar epimerase
MTELPTGSGIPAGLRILVAGASGASGRAVSAALQAAA